MSHWHIVAHSSELSTPGSYVLLPWAVDSEVAVANIGGEIIAFDNRCSHRGARIYDGIVGRREPRCVYHGRLATADNVRHHPMMRIGGWILVKDGPTWNGEVLPLKITEFLYSVPDLAPHSLLPLTMDCDVTVAVENALDFEHVEHVHKGSLFTLRLNSISLDTCEDGSSIERFIGWGVASGARAMKMRELFPSSDSFGYNYVHAHLFPGSCLSSTSGWTYSLQNYFPRADGRTTFIHRLYAAPSTRPLPQFFDSAAAMNEKVFREDAQICARVPAGHSGALGPHDRRIAHFRGALPDEQVEQLKREWSRACR